MIDTDTLRKKVIDLAIQGKLTVHLSEDGDAEQIRRDALEYKRLLDDKGVLKNRKAKKTDEIEADDCPYIIPSTWRWFRLGEISEVFGRIGFRGYTKSDLTLIEYMEKLLQFRMMNILDISSLNRIADSTKSETLESWIQYISLIEQQDDNYKIWLKEHLSLVNQNYQEKRDKNTTFNEYEKHFLNLLLNLLEREVHVSINTLLDKDGNVVLRTHMRVFDKKQQKYLESLDGIVDTVIRIDLSSSQDNDNTDDLR